VCKFQNMNPTDDYAYGPNDLGELQGGCRKCQVIYGSASELKLHFASAHQRQTFECFVCNKLFLQKFNFLAHIDRVHPELGKNFSCQFCDRVYTTREALDEHIKQSHKTPLLICPMCQKNLPSRESLKKHVSICQQNETNKNKLSIQGSDLKFPCTFKHEVSQFLFKKKNSKERAECTF